MSIKDVYKRQDFHKCLYRIRTCKDTDEAQQEIAEMETSELKHPQSLKSVSYTHLDVYKRQVIKQHRPVFSRSALIVSPHETFPVQAVVYPGHGSHPLLSLIHI